MRRHLPALSLLAAVVACQPAAPKVDAAAEEAAIRAQVAAFNAAAASGDGAAVAAFYTPDAVLMAPNQGGLEGTAQIQEFFGGMKQLGASVVATPVAIEIAAAGDIAIEEGTWASTVPTPDGGIYKDNGKYLVAWKKVNGAWLMQVDTWNSDNAPLDAK